MTFTFTIPDNEHNHIAFDYDEAGREELDVSVEDGTAAVFANREGMITLAKLLLKIAYGSYTEGFHVHLRKDLNADAQEVLTLGLLGTSDKP